MGRQSAAVCLAAVLALAGAACSSGPASSPGGSPSAASGAASAVPAPSTAPSASASAPAGPSVEPSVEPSPPAASMSPASSAAASAAPSAAARPTGWSAVAATGPAGREDHTWTIASDGGGWLFGGRDGGTVFGDLWRYDLASDAWAEVAVAGPAPDARFGHTSTWVDGVGLVIWSGQAGPTFFDDLWAFDPAASAWRELAAEGPAPAARYGSCAALDPDGRLWVSHGFTADAGRFADTWTHDFGAGRWAEVAAEGDVPLIRCLHDCLFTPEGRFLIYAGQTTGVPAIGDLWTRPVDGAWTAAPAPPPPARQLYAVATRGNHAWVFGGGGEDRSKLGDLWSLDLGSLAWEEVVLDGDAPAGRSGAALVDDPDRRRILLFGGLTEDGASAEVWTLEFGG